MSHHRWDLQSIFRGEEGILFQGDKTRHILRNVMFLTGSICKCMVHFKNCSNYSSNSRQFWILIPPTLQCLFQGQPPRAILRKRVLITWFCSKFRVVLAGFVLGNSEMFLGEVWLVEKNRAVLKKNCPCVLKVDLF